MKYLEVGKIVSTHGIRGEVKVSITTSFPEERFEKGNTLYILKDNKYLPIVIDTFRVHKNMGLVSFNKLTNINNVLEYVGCTIYVDKETLEELDEDDFYFDDLIGLNAKTVSGEEIGIVEDILEVPQGAILVIKKDKKESLVPFVSEFIEDVDLDNEEIVINPIEGLL